MFNVNFVQEVVKKRSELTNVLLDYVLTDTLLFLPCGDDFEGECENNKEQVKKVNDILNTKYEVSYGFDICEQNIKQRGQLYDYLEKLDDKKFAILYKVSCEVCSVLLGVLFVEKKIDGNELFDLALFEELAQQKKWGIDDIIEQKHYLIRKNLKELEEAV